ncbi:MAG: putative nucleotide-diphospho-sugar transferase [Alphaproteobacteria bacterium]
MKVVTSVNGPYLRLLDIWLRQAAPFLHEPLLVCCTDDEAFVACSDDPRVEAVRPPDRSGAGIDRHAFWHIRFSFLKDRLEQGEDILHTDLDAFWLHDPQPLLEDQDADIVFSREFGIPRDIGEQWGFTLCCGFFLARSTPAVKNLFDRWEPLIRERLSDQIAFNVLLHQLGADWQPVDLNGQTAHRAEIELDGKSLSLLALPYETVSRELPFAASTELVTHPFFERSYFVSYLDLLDQYVGVDVDLPELPHDAAFLTADSGAPKKRDLDAYRVLLWLGQTQRHTPNTLAHQAAIAAGHGWNDQAVPLIDQAFKSGVDEDGSRVALAGAMIEMGQRRRGTEVLRPFWSRGTTDLSLAREAGQILVKARAPVPLLQLVIRMVRLLGLSRAIKLAWGWRANA